MYIFVYFFVSHNYPVVTLGWENSTHCWHYYEWVTVLGVLQRTDFCLGETKRLCKAAAVRAIILVALVPATKSRAWSRVSWSRAHHTPPAASPTQTQQQFFGGFSGSQPFLLHWASAAGERARTMPNRFLQCTFVHVCIHKHFVTVIQLHILVEGVNFFADQAEKKNKNFCLQSAEQMHLSSTGKFFKL